MKRILTITGICIAGILLVMLILPFALKGKVTDIVKTEGNKMINAQFDFEELDISLFRHFPSATISLEDFWLKGEGKFENDTLAMTKSVSVTVNLLSLFRDGGYEISEIILDDINLHAITLEDGSVNWDIMKNQHESTQEEATDPNANAAFRIQLKNLLVEGLTATYDNRQKKLFAEINDLSAECSGDFGSEQTLLKVKAESPAVSYKSNGVTILNKVRIASGMDIDADFKNKLYTLKDNQLTLNAIEANLDGWMKGIDDGWDMDLKLYSNKVGFKEILSLIPGMYTKEFEDLKTDGKVKFTAFAKGMLKGDSVVPQFKIDLDVKNGMFKYPSLPSSVDQINLAMSIQNPGGNPDATTVDVNPVSFALGGQPFNLTVQLKNPISDLDFNLAAKGNLNLNKVKEVCPINDMNLNGKIHADMHLSGKLSAIEKERFEDIKAEGKLTLNDMLVELPYLPNVKIEQSIVSFSPKILKLSETTVIIGKNDLTFNSQFENYLAFAFQGKTLKGSLNVKSDYLNLNDFITTKLDNQTNKESEEASTDAANKTELETTKNDMVTTTNQAPGNDLVIPANIDFSMQTNMKQVFLDKMKFENINGLLLIKNQEVNMKNLSMETMGGKLIANGVYATPNKKQSSLNGSFALQKLDFRQTYTELDVVKQLAPIFAGLKGTYSGSITLASLLDEQLSIDVKTVQGKGNLSTNDMSLSGVKFIDQIANIIKKPELKDIKVQDLNLDFVVDDGRVTTQPFNLRLGDYSMNLSGSTGLDQSINYRGKITLPSSSNGKKRYGTVDMLIKGTFDQPEVSIDMASLAKHLAGQLFDNLLDDKKANKEDSLNTKKKNILDKALDLFK